MGAILARAAVGGAVVLAVAGRGEAGGVPARASGGPGFALLQMNLCLSGYASCFARVAYPGGVDDAVARIRTAGPDAVTLNEMCRRDAAAIARRAGYRLRFSDVTVGGAPLRCVRPGGRGAFGDAVLTRAAVAGASGRDFRAQAGPERRRWLCVSTRGGVDVCTAHLASRSESAAVNDAQCAELAAVLARRAATRTVVFGGDVNRRAPCAPARGWARTDAAARQAPGLQGVWASGALRPASARVLPAARTDHDALLVRARRAAPAR